MEPFFVRAAGDTVEVWSGYRIQFGGMERHTWQTVLKARVEGGIVTAIVKTVDRHFTGRLQRVSRPMVLGAWTDFAAGL